MAVFRYDRAKLPVCILYPDGMDLRFRYDEKARLISSKKAGSLETSYVYDENGDKVREWDSAGRDTRYVYVRNHLLIQRRDWKESSGEYGAVTAYEYECPGKAYQTDLAGGKERFLYL